MRKKRKMAVMLNLEAILNVSTSQHFFQFFSNLILQEYAKI
jgi:hypothetical protein